MGGPVLALRYGGLGLGQVTLALKAIVCTSLVTHSLTNTTI
jgi:hypothetical protein